MPLSPVTSTVASLSARLRMNSNVRSITGARPIMPEKNRTGGSSVGGAVLMGRTTTM